MKNGEYARKWVYYFEDGKMKEEIFYDFDNNKTILKNIWDKNGNQIIINGNGFYKEYADNGRVVSSGEVKNGEKTGVWQTFSEDGTPTEEGIYENGMYKIINAWNPEGKQMIKNGEGNYKIYFSDGTKVLMAGEIKNGLKEGTWDTYYSSTNLLNQIEYVNGKQSGLQKSFYESGEIYSEGNMVDDKQEGIWKWYHENGKLSSSVQFHNGKKEGTQTMYDDSDRKTKEEYYKNGELTGLKLFQ